MFKRSKCELLERENTHLREQNEKLLDRCMALADARAFAAVRVSPVDDDTFYGGGKDEFIEHDQYGQRVIRVESKPEVDDEEVDTRNAHAQGSLD